MLIFMGAGWKLQSLIVELLLMVLMELLQWVSMFYVK